MNVKVVVRIAQRPAKCGVVVHLGFQNRQARGTALLARMAEGGLHQILDRQIAVGLIGDDDRILPAGLGKELQARSPA